MKGQKIVARDEDSERMNDVTDYDEKLYSH